MKIPRLFALLVLFVISLHIVAKDDDDAVTQQETDASQEKLKKEARVKEAKAQFNEKQKLFDTVAAELQEARNQYLQEVYDKDFHERTVVQEYFDEMVHFAKEITEQSVPWPLTLERDAAFTDAVIGVRLGEATDNGVPIREVIESAPANIAGIQPGDVILQIDDVDVSDLDNPTESTAELISSNEPGSIVRFTLQRDDEELEIDVATIDRNSLNRISTPTRAWQSQEGGVRILEPEGWYYPVRSFQGTNNKIFVMEIEEDFGRYFDVEYGVLVLKADDVEGIQAGDILLKVDDKPVRSLSHAVRHRQDAGDEVEILFKRNKREKSVTLEKDQFSLHAILE